MDHSPTGRKLFVRMRSRSKLISIFLAGMLAGSLLVPPVGAHFAENTKHLGRHAWREVIKKKVYTKRQINRRTYTRAQANDRYYTRAQANDRYLTQSQADRRYEHPLGVLPFEDSAVTLDSDAFFPTPPVVELGTIDVPDDCGDGSTRHTLALDIGLLTFAGNETDAVNGQFILRFDGVDVAGTDILVAAVDDFDDRTVHFHRVVEDVEPGAVTISARATAVGVTDSTDPRTITIRDRQGTVTSLGYTCG